jgi:predicted kinase
LKNHLEIQIKGDIIIVTVALQNARLVSDSLRLLESLEPLPEPVAESFFITVSGLPGTGKSYFCHRLVEKLPAALLESDALRKVLFPSPDYSAAESEHLFRSIYFLVEKLLLKGVPVILDATNLSESNREYLYGIAGRLKVKFLLVRVIAPPQVVSQRLQSRQTDTMNKSDADWAVYRKMQPLEEKIRRKHYTVDTSRDISTIVNRVVREALR